MLSKENYKVEIEVFQGPLDLLLHLIEKENYIFPMYLYQRLQMIILSI